MRKALELLERGVIAVCIAAVWGCAPVGMNSIEGSLEDNVVDEEEVPTQEEMPTEDVETDVDFAPKDAGYPGSSCRCDGDCDEVDGHGGLCVYGICMTRATTSCASGGSSSECASGSRCWGLAGFDGSVCWPDVDAYPECVGVRDADGSCFFTNETTRSCDPSCSAYCPASNVPSSTTISGSIGDGCAENTDCVDDICYSAAGTGWAEGYCMVFGCEIASAPCGEGGVCVEGISTRGNNICMRPCGTSADCREDFVCRTIAGEDICWPGERCAPDHPDGRCPGDLTCVEGECRTECSSEHLDGWCPSGLECLDGVCASTTSDGCGSWECSGADCSDIVLVSGSSDAHSARARDDGYYLAHGEAYSYLRRDLAVLVQWAACKMQERFPGVSPLGLLDLTTSAGATPGCPDDCRHPDGTHRGSDLDTAYFQTDGSNNGQCICGDGTASCWNGYSDEYSDGYQCTTEENIMDLEQQIWFLVYMAHHPSWRVVGVDESVCDDLNFEADALLDRGEIDSTIHSRITNLGCYGSHSSWAFHHHHLHFSFL